jgi:Holliday junction resolvasome RuvABC endonuclease subunit
VIIFSIDPATGATSPMGLAAIDFNALKLIYTREITTKQDATLHHKLVDLTEQVQLTFEELVRAYPNEEIVVASEVFVMKGKSGEILQRLIGACMSDVPTQYHFEEVVNTTMKKLVCGRGDGDKLDVALGCQYFFLANPKSYGYLAELIKNQAWDRTDAIAIGIAAFIQLAYANDSYKDIEQIKLYSTDARKLWISERRAALGIAPKSKKRKAVK